MQKRLFALAAVVGAGALGIWGYQFYSNQYPSTEDAYITADVVRVAPRVSGRIDTLEVSNHQLVHKSDELFHIDPAPYQFAVEQAQAQLALAKRQVNQAEAAVASAQAEVHNREVLLDNTRDKLNRLRGLEKKEYVSKENVTDAEANYKSAQANLEVARARLEEAHRNLGNPGDQNDRIVQARAQLDKAQWDLDNTRVSAACTGQVSELDLQPGNIVNTGRDVFVLVCQHGYWVDANYKETQLERIHPGQPAEIEIDMYPGHVFHGIVENISPATGSVFSLLPPQNANGNWVKVTQRIPVHIRIDNPGEDFPLRVGTSTKVTIDTTASSNQDKLAGNTTVSNLH
ncbi:MAG: HlyD family secretion protein [Thiohalophilus sp.]|jgi:membrane fusion protein (multidrug efflux system)